jgi:hypothetical protein
MDIQLIREYHPNGVNGILSLGGEKICDTIELPWRNNQRRVSCIPEGTYKIRRRYTVKFGWHCWVENVPGRDAILIHAFNDALKESKGCIGPVSRITGEGKGVFSKIALKKLMGLLAPAFDRRESVYLTIKKNENDNHQES